MHLPGAIAAVGSQMHLGNQIGQPGVRDRPLRHGPGALLAEPALGDPEHSADMDREPGGDHLDRRVPLWDPRRP